MPVRFEVDHSKTAQDYRAQAAEMRQWASTMGNGKLRSLLLKNAEAYERQAEGAEDRRK
jgi:hypothetical protein